MDAKTEFLNDVITTAVEGGINYWAAVSDYKWGDDILTTVNVHELDEETGDYAQTGVPVTPEKIEAAIRRIMNPDEPIEHLGNHVRSTVFGAYMSRDAGEIDADVADCVMQVAVLGKIVYG